MADPDRRRVELLVLALGLVFLLGWVGWRLRSSIGGKPAPTSAEALLGTTDSGREKLHDSRTLTWEAVSAVGAAEDPSALPEIPATVTNPPAQYLRALLLLAQTNAPAALAAFEEIGADRIPATHLYAPYRLHGLFRSGQTNPFLPGLQRALAKEQLDPLTAARVQAREGVFDRAVQYYLKTDPARWVRQDLELFRLLLSHEGVAAETRILLEAALRGDRVSPELRAEFRQFQLPVATGGTNADPALTRRLSNYFRQHPAELGLAVTGAVKQLALRRQFLEKKYADILRAHAAAEPTGLADETVLLLVLAAASETNATALDSWSQELRRRFPEKEVEQWLQTLRPVAR